MADYLSVVGILHPDNSFDWRPGYIIDRPPVSPPDGDGSALIAEVLGDRGEVLLHAPVPLGSPCGDTGDRAPALQIAAGAIPFPETAHVVRLRLEDILIAERRRPAHPPALQLEWQPGATVDGVEVVRYSISADDVEAVVAYSHDGGDTWRALAPSSHVPGLDVDFSQLPGGERCLVQVVASDGFHTVKARSQPFAVPGKGWRAFILAPCEGAELVAGQPLWLQGQGYHLERGEVELDRLRWRSGEQAIGRGAAIPVTLPPGDHRLTLEVDVDGEQGLAHVKVHVCEP